MRSRSLGKQLVAIVLTACTWACQACQTGRAESLGAQGGTGGTSAGGAGTGGAGGTGPGGAAHAGGAGGAGVSCYRDPYLPNVYAPPCVHPPVEARCFDEMCMIPAGCFIAGAPWCEVSRAKYSEDPTQVTFTHDLWIGRTEVTQKQWKAAGFANPSRPDPAIDGTQSCVADECPVSRVTWYEAVAFTNTLSTRAGLKECYELQGCTGVIGVDFTCSSASSLGSIYECDGYRLPTSPEWEYAARAGTKTAYYLGDFAPPPAPAYGCERHEALDQIAWYCHNSGTRPTAPTHPVALKLPNAWGLYDVIGNVNEWVSDRAYPSFADLPPQVDPSAQVFVDGTPTNMPAQRGGEVLLWPEVLRVAFVWPAPLVDRRYGGNGFRLARTVTKP